MTATVTESIRSIADRTPRHPAAVPERRPQEQGTMDRILPGTRPVLIAFAVFTLLATVELVVFTASTERYFAWTIDAEPAAAFLGAAYAAGLLLSVRSLRRDRWGDIRIAVITVTAFAMLTLVASLLHLHKFHLMTGGPVARLAAWVWLIVYVVIPVACAVVVARQEQRRGRPEMVHRPMPGWLVKLLAGQSIALFTSGALLFAGGATRHHHMPTAWTGFWPLPVAPLAAQAIGAWLLAFALAAALAIRQRDLSRLGIPALVYAAFGAFQLLVVVRYWEQVSASDPWLWGYLVLLASIVVAGGSGWWRARPIG
jgi:uncharacterized integral membrane protein